MGIKMKKRMVKLFKVVVSGILSSVLILSPLKTNFKEIYANSSGVAFAGFNTEMYSPFASDLSTIDAQLSNGIISFSSENGSAIQYIDLQSISASVDLGNLSISYSTLALIASELGFEDDEATFHLIFTSEESLENPLKTISVDRSSLNSGTYETLSGNVVIPEGTRFIFAEFSAKGYGLNSVQFQSTSLKIIDNEDPLVTALYNQTWTNAPVTVLVTALDSQSGVEGIYDANSGEKVAEGGVTSFISVSNETRSYYAVDYSGRTSPTFEVSVENIDTIDPLSAPILSPSSTSWTKNPIEVSLSSVTPALNQSPEKRQVQLDDGLWIDYTSTFTISTDGQHKVNARVMDEAGNVSPISSKTYQLDQSAPIITALSAYSDPQGGASVTFTASDAYSGGVVRKYAQGVKDSAYFETSGTVLSLSTFTVALGGTYTVYAADALGNAVVETITIDTFPFVEAIVDKIILEDISTEVSFVISDSETSFEDLVVEITSSQPSLLPSPTWVKDGSLLVLTLSPEANQNGGPVTISVSIKDGSNNITTKTFKVTVTAVNDRPEASSDIYETNEDTPITFNPLLNDDDLENDVLTIQGITSASFGAFVIASDGKSITYTPNLNRHGIETATVTISDGTDTSTSSLVLTVLERNDAPKANSDTFIINEDVSTELNVLSNDTDVDLGNTLNELLTIDSLSNPSHGIVRIVGTVIEYTPDLNWSGKDVFTYTILDAVGISSTTSVTVYVRTINDAPNLIDLEESVSILEDSERTMIHFSISDIETKVQDLMVQVASLNESIIPSSSLQLTGVGLEDGEIDLSFDVLAQKSGTATISIRVSDGFSVTTKLLLVHIGPVNDAPIAKDDLINYVEDQPLTIDTDFLLANDTDIDGDALSFVDFLPLTSSGSLVQVEGQANKWVFTPAANATQDYTLTYTITDGTTLSEGVLVLKAVAQNDVPIITVDPLNPNTIDEDSVDVAYVFELDDFETASDLLSITVRTDKPELLSSTSIKTQLVGSTLTVLISPTQNQNGTLHMTLDVSDGSSIASTTTTITVTAVNDAPFAYDDEIYVDGAVKSFIDVLANDSDLEADVLSVINVTQPSHGTVVLVDGKVYYTSSSSYRGLDEFTVTISDGQDTCVSSVVVSVGGFFFAPVISPLKALFILEDQSSSEILFTVSDRDQDSLTIEVTSVTSPLISNDDQHILLTDKGNGLYGLVLVPNENQSGSTTIQITADDGTSVTTRSFQVTVVAVEDTPLAVDDEVETNEDESVLFSPNANDVDPDSFETMLQLLSIDQPAHGTIQLINGAYRYTPDRNYYGNDSATYTATDGHTIVSATVNFTVHPVNDAPITSTWALELLNEIGQTLTINPLTKVNEPDGDVLSIEISSAPGYGTLEFNALNQLVYTRSEISPNTNGLDEFTLTYRDPSGATTTRLIEIRNITPASFGSYNVYEYILEDSGILTIQLPVNNPDGDPVVFSVSSPQKGQIISLDPDTGLLKYQPNPDENGIDLFSFSVKNQVTNVIITKSITITITPVGDVPIQTPDKPSLTWDEDHSSQMISVLTHDADGDSLSVIASIISSEKIIFLPSGLSLERVEDSINIVLTPLENAFGNAVLRITTSDGLNSTHLEVPLKVLPINDAPVAVDLSEEVNEDETLSLVLMDALSDIEDDALSLIIDQDPSHGTLILGENGQVSYHPNQDYYGADEFTYHLNDGALDSNQGTISIQVNGKNDAPFISNLQPQVVLNEDNTITITFTILDPDQDSLSLSLSNYMSELYDAQDIIWSTENNVVSMTITPNPNTFGSTKVLVSLSDGIVSVSRNLDILVMSVNDDPFANEDEVTVNEDTINNIDVLVNDSDLEMSILRILAITSSTHGAEISVNPDGTIHYVPQADWFGTDEFTLTIGDADGGQATSKLIVHVDPVNDAPLAVDDTVSLIEDTVTIIDVLSNDGDPESDPLTIQILTEPSHGSVSINLDKTITYTPDLNYYGEDNFTYQLSDGTDGDEASVILIVSAQNDIPVITNTVTQNEGIWTMNEDTQASFTFDLNDPETDVRYLILTIDSSNPSLIPNTSITYEGTSNEKTITLIPEENQNGSLILTITASDGVNSNVYEITVNVLAVNDSPVLTDLEVTLEEEGSYNGHLEASDVDSVNLSYSLKTNAQHATIIVDENGDFHILTDENYNGLDSFVITVNDNSLSATATTDVTVKLIITQVNDAPLADDITTSTLEDTPLDITIDLTQDIDLDPQLNLHPEEEVLHIDPNGFSGTTHGQLAVNGSVITYTPDANYNGIVSFDYTIVDESGSTSQATINITVTSVNDAPLNGDDTVSVIEDTPKELIVLGNDDVDMLTNPSTESLNIKAIAIAPSYGTASITSDSQRILYTPNLNYFGSDSLEYTVEDASGSQKTFKVSITVSSVNDTPTITLISNQTILEDEMTEVLSFVVNDVEDGGAITVTASSNSTSLVPNNASYLVMPITTGTDRTIKVIPAANQNGSVIITLTVKDQNNKTATTSFEVTVTPVNDNPAPVNDSSSTNENKELGEIVDVLANDDVDMITNPLTETLKLVSIVDADGISVAGEWKAEIVDDGTSRNKLKFIPDPDWTSKVAVVEVLRYTMEDKDGLQQYTGLLSMTVNPINDAPTISVISDQSFNEDNADGFGTLVFQISDEEDGYAALSLSAISSLTSLIANEDLLLSVLTTSDATDRTIKAKALADQNGSSTITVRVTDTDDAYSTSDFEVLVNPVDDAPRNGNDTYTLDEDTVTVLDVLSNDDIDLDTNAALESVIIESVTQPDYGTITISSDKKTLEYTPQLNHYGSASFSYTMNSLTGKPGTFTVDLTIDPINDAPVIVTDIPDTTVNEGQSSGAISFTLSDVDDDLDSLTLISNSTNKVLVPLANISIVDFADGLRQITLTPNGKWNGTTTIELTAKDPLGLMSVKETFKFIVNSVNEAPTANADLNSVINEDGTILINVLANDTDPDISSNSAGVEFLSVISNTNPSHGVVVQVGNTLRYTPSVNYNGFDTFTYTISDASGLTSTATVKVKINGRNDAPTVVHDEATTNEDTSIILDLLSNDSDIDQDVLLNTDTNISPSLEILSIDPDGFSDVTHGSVSLNAEGKAVFVPEEDFNGEITFTYTTKDPSGAKTTGTITITILSINDDPMATDDDATISEDGSLSLDLAANDLDIDMDPTKNAEIQEALIYELLDSPLHGIASLQGSILSYTPAKDDNRSVTLTYQVTDPSGETDTATISISITPGNDAPVANEESVNTNEDQSLDIDVSTNDTDIDQDTLINVLPNDVFSVTSVTSPSHGTVTILNSKEVRYTPTNNYNGTDSFTYTITDEGGLTSTTTVNVTIKLINDAPTAVNDTKSGNEDTDISINVLANDTDVDMDSTLNDYPRTPESLSLKSISSVTNGTAEFTAEGLITLTPTTNFNGSVVITYTMMDSDGVEKSATVTFSVTTVNDEPVAVSDEVSTYEDTLILIDVLANDTDVDLASDLNNPVTEVLSLVSVASVSHGTATIVSGKVRFTPAANFNGTGSFTYTMKDKAGVQKSTTVTVTIVPTEDNPVAVADSVSTPEDESILVDVLANDTDVDKSTTLNLHPSANPLSQTLSVFSIASVTHGSAVIEDNKVRFTPDANYNGLVSFNVTIQDNTGRSSTALLSISIGAVNDGPSATNDEGSMSEDTVKDFDVLVNDTDIDLDTLTNTLDPQSLSVRIISVDSGSATVVNNKIRLSPIANFNKTITVVYEAYDQHNASAQATLSVEVTQVNDSPVANDDAVNVDEDGSVEINPLDNDTDIDMNVDLNAQAQLEVLHVSSCGEANHGSVTCLSDTIIYTPDPHHNGTDAFTVTIIDESGSTHTSNVFVTIKPQNDSPMAMDDELEMNEDTSILIDVLGNDLDKDLDLLLNAEVSEILSIIDSSWIGVKHGEVKLEGTKIRYTPEANFNGSESFTIDIEDQAGVSSTSTVMITVDAVNDAPTATEDELNGEEDQSYLVDVLSNDSDVDFDLTLNFLASEDWTIEILSSNALLNASVVDNKISLNPQANVNGTFVIEYRVTDMLGDSDEAQLVVNLEALNDDPLASNDNVTTDEDQSVTIDVLKNDTDIDQDPLLNLYPITEVLTITDITQGELGTVTIVDNQLLYTPKENRNGDDTFAYTITDEHGISSTAFVYVTLKPVNDGPKANPDTASLNEDDTILVNVLVNDTDVDALEEFNASPTDVTLVILSFVSIDHATISIVENKLHVKPDQNFNGDLVIKYTVVDHDGVESDSELSVTVHPLNDVPVAGDDEATVDEDHSLLIDVLSNDTDVDGLSIINVSPLDEVLSLESPLSISDKGTLTKDGNKILFTPNENVNGDVSFSYTIVDVSGSTDTGVVTIHINPINDALLAKDDEATTDEDRPITIDVLANDTDVDAVCELSGVCDESDRILLESDLPLLENAVLSIVDQKIVVTPNNNFNGIISFTYLTRDAQAAYTSALVSVTVNSVNDQPNALPDGFTIYEDESSLFDVLSNDGDIDTDGLLNQYPLLESISLMVGGFTNSIHGSVSIEGSSVRFIPEINYNGDASFEYTIIDEAGETSTAIVNITILKASDSPVALDDEVEVDEDEELIVDVLANDHDIDFDPDLNLDPDQVALKLLEIGLGTPKHGTVVLVNNTLKYTPKAHFNGTDEVSYVVVDEDGNTDEAVLKITILPVNNAPIAVGDEFEIDEDQEILLDVLNNDEDIDFDPELNLEGSGEEMIILNEFEKSSSVTLSVVDGKILFVPHANFNGSVEFDYTIRDKHNETSTAHVLVYVHSVNDSPIAVKDNYEMDEDGHLQFNPLLNDGDIDSDLLLNEEYVSAEPVLIGTLNSTNPHGTWSFENGVFDYVPDLNFNGEVIFTYTIKDESNEQSSAEIKIMVHPINDPVVAMNDEMTLNEDDQALIKLITNDLDEDLSREGDHLTILEIGQPKHGQIKIMPDKQSVLYTPYPDSNGMEEVFYTVVDQFGLTSIAKVKFVVSAVNDAPSGLVVLTPTEDEATKDGQTVHITWTNSEDLDFDQLTYKLEFFDGTEWSVLAERLTDPAFDHLLNTSVDQTTVAKYRVSASDGRVEISAISEEFIIDNRAPEKFSLTLTCNNGEEAKNGICSDGLNFGSTPGEDLLDFVIEYRVLGETDWQKLSSKGIQMSKFGEYQVEVRATDILGNSTTLTTVIIIKDGSPLAQPQNWIILMSLFLLLIIILLTRRQVIIVYYGIDNQGKDFRVQKKRFARRPKKDKPMDLRIPVAPDNTSKLEVIYTKAFTKSMRSRTTKVNHKGTTLGTFMVSRDERGRNKVTYDVGK